ncbi:MAG: DUF3667 domain-containing protein [Saprospiraceae bacterium]|nr:DUF3667 domain-containing protein [Lewinella sp.]
MKRPRIRLFPNIKRRRGTLGAEGDKGQRYCPNCHYPLPHYGEYCSNCGQQYTDGRVPLKSLLGDFLENVLNVDSKFFRTVVSLAIPGKLTNEFFKGHHKRYASPARLFFVATVIHFGVLGYILNDIISNGAASLLESSKREAYEKPLRDSLQKHREEVALLFPNKPDVNRAMDSLFTRIQVKEGGKETINYIFLNSNWEIEQRERSFITEELFRHTPAELAKQEGITNKMESLIFQQYVKVRTHPDTFGPYLIAQLVWMVVMMMPALALILKLLYIRRNRYFVEHLVFSFHYHAFAFWVISIMLLMMTWTDSWENETAVPIVSTFTVFGILIYLFVAMRRVYRQGFFKTFFKYNFLNFAYMFIFSLFLGLTFVISALLF